MDEHIIETSYPLSFRQEEATKLGELLKNRRSVVLLGMKRVGISNFLRFFLYHKDVAKTYLNEEKHLFIPVNLNDLVEREIYPFWVLTLKRIDDAVKGSQLPEKVKKQVELYFLDSIQSQDLFLTIDYIRKSLILLTEAGILPTLFYLRFDRMKDSATTELFANFQGLIDATHRKLCFVFTSVRPLNQLSPEVFSKQAVSVMADNLYVKPAKASDTKTVFETSLKSHPIELTEDMQENLFSLVDGYIQYLQFAMISLREEKVRPKTREELFKYFLADERISLQSEELWESLTAPEQEVLIKILTKKPLSDKDLIEGDYLIKTGFFDLEKKKIFSPLFEDYVKAKGIEHKGSGSQEFTKKELSLLNFLKEHKNEVCEREQIIENVWPEAEELGVSDWAIDRLVARVRNKLKNQGATAEIVTIKTRGYKLVE